MSLKLRVTEMFYSIQGEGLRQGVPSIFVRLWGCNLYCGYTKNRLTRQGLTWACDSLSSWQYGKDNTMTYTDPDFLVKDITALKPPEVDSKLVDIVFTGGEPLLFINDSFLEILDKLHLIYKYESIYFETNGTLDINRFKHTLDYVKFNCSPKLENSGMELDDRYKPDVLRKIATIEGSCFKFVINALFISSSVVEIQTLIRQSNIPDHMIYLMPEGQTRGEIEKNLLICAELSKKYGYRVSNRMQVQIWNKCMGV